MLSLLKRPNERFIITISALALVVIHSIKPEYLPNDSITIGLLVFAALPWVFSFVSSAKGPGGLEIQFREIKEEQQRQKNEIEILRFLISHFVTDFELRHLQTLATGAVFPFKRNNSFVTEIRRLRSFGLLNTLPGKRLAELPMEGDLREFVTITEKGKSYLQLRSQGTPETASGN
jgi:hypothetical protein